MSGISIHVVDVARGIVAQALAVSVSRVDAQGSVLLCRGRIGADGCLTALDSLASPCVPGVYEVTLSAGTWYREHGMVHAVFPFLDEIIYRFGLADVKQHYHLPFKLTPWGLSCFRGGA